MPFKMLFWDLLTNLCEKEKEEEKKNRSDLAHCEDAEDLVW